MRQPGSAKGRKCLDHGSRTSFLTKGHNSGRDVALSTFNSTPLCRCEHGTHDCTEIDGYCTRTFSACKDTAVLGHELLIDDLSCSIDQGVEIGLALFDMDNFGLQIPIISREAPEDIEGSCAEPSDARDSHSVVILVVQAASVRLWGTTRLSD